MFDNAGGEKGWMITRLGVGEQWTPGRSQDIMWGIVVNDHRSHYTGLKPLKHSSSHTDLLSST